MIKFICDCITYLQNLLRKKIHDFNIFLEFRKINSNHHNKRLSRTSPQLCDTVQSMSSNNAMNNSYFYKYEIQPEGE